MIGINGLLDGYYFWWCPIFPSHGTFTNPWQVQIQQNCVVLWLPNMRDMRVSTNAKGDFCSRSSATARQQWQWHASEVFWKLRKVHFGKGLRLVNVHKKTNWKDPPFKQGENMGKSTISTGSFSVAMPPVEGHPLSGTLLNGVVWSRHEDSISTWVIKCPHWTSPNH